MCPFIPAEELKVIEIDLNVLIFKLKNQDAVDKVIEEGPWNIDGKLCILYDYFLGLIHQDLDWSKQVYWIQLKFLQPEHMNVKSVEEMGKLLGEVLAIEPKKFIPEDGVTVKVCVRIDLKTPLRRGVLVITAAGSTKWVRFFYEKQPSKIFRECFMINHCNGVCKDVADYIKAAHEKSLPFGGVGVIKKSMTVRSSTSNTPKPSVRRSAKVAPFVPPVDGKIMVAQIIAEVEDEGGRLGKRQRFVKEGEGQSNNDVNSDELATARITQMGKQSGSTTWELQEYAMVCDVSQSKH
ncbi:uncharacterized protein LOC113301953 [Papaver somniferum]|uniref:uncharacterized protein LOC113301953 n=1 Tax=Papaver somniferum TaxID=3469 RepID=UPI000E6F79CF|nr:uncharacterized protein LOC113301953 [Papaver somniferum]XP_026406570.1 uncharacterized protein LOC113301953 [Papaver somniferum]XP_026406571.1 uncharacterized protein LOC113301953 [Papaver somniferum]